MQVRPSQPTDAKTARLSAPANANSANNAPARERSADARGQGGTAPRPPAPPPPAPPAPTPSAGQTRAIPVPTNRSGDDKSETVDPTAALPVIRSEAKDSGAATEQLNARAQNDRGGQSDNGDTPRQRRRASGGGAGVSAQDLLRREGRL
jgi:RND superfamily putative drug exporter